MPLSIRSGAVSLAGRREANDDAVSTDEAGGLYLIADGTGSRGGGHVAAQLACEAIEAELTALRSDASAKIEPAIQRAIARAHRTIRERQADPNMRGMATTVVVLLTIGDRLHIAHVGDSRAYLLRKGQLLAMTRDHNVANYLADHPENAPKIQRPGDTLMRALGLNADPPECDQRSLELEPGDLVLACSDGVSSFLPEWSMLGILSTASTMSPREVASTLASAAIAQGSMDNASALVLAATKRVERRAVLGWLAFLEGPRQGQVIPVERAAKIGKGQGFDITTDDEAASEIRASESGFMLRDVGSAKGTFLNDLPVQEAPLMDGDVIRVGSTKMIFKCYRAP